MISYIVLFLIFKNIKCNKSVISLNISNSSFFGIYRIDISNKRRTLSFIENKLEFTIFKNLNNQFRIYPSEIKPFYYIELKSNKKRLGVKRNNNLKFFKKKDNNININQVIWEIVKISQNNYLIKNQYNNKYLQKINISIQCMEDYNLINSNVEKESFKFSFFKLYEEPTKKKEYKKIIEKEPIDIVIKYTDKTLIRKGIKSINKDFEDIELRYSIRSILNNVPWIRKLFIIISNENIKFLKPIEEIKNKIIYIKDKDLLEFDSSNRQALIYNFYKLGKFGVSDNFIYMEDNYFIGRSLNKTNLFYYEEDEKKVKPCIINYYIKEFNKDEVKKNYYQYFENNEKISLNTLLGCKMALANTDYFFLENYNLSHLVYPHFTNNAIPMNIHDLKEISQELQKYYYLNESLYSNEEYTKKNIIVQHFYSLYYLNVKNRKVRQIPCKYVKLEKVLSYKLYIPLFAINNEDDELISQNEKYGIEIIKKRFPYPTKYEIEYNNFEEFEKRDNDFHMKTKNLRGYEGAKISKIKIILYFFLLTIIVSFIIYILYRKRKRKEISKYTRIYNFEQ